MTCVNPGCEVRKSIRLDKVEPLVLNELKKALDGFNYFLDEPEKKPENELNLLNRELKTKEKQIDRACELLEQGIYDIDRFKSRTSLIQKDIERIKSRISELSTPKPNNRAKIPILEKVFEVYPDLNRADKNKLLRTVIKKIAITEKDDGIDLDMELLI